jgi:two-component system, LytTR family, sensor kinase
MSQWDAGIFNLSGDKLRQRSDELWVAAMNSQSGVMKRSTLFLAATGFGVSSTLQVYWLERGAHHPIGPGLVLSVFLLNLIYWYVPAALAPVIMALSLRYHPDRTPMRVVVLVHVAGVVVYSWVHTAIMLGARSLMSGLVPARTATESWAQFALHHYLTQLDWLLMTYLFLVGLAYALAYRHESADRALSAARLETRIVEAQLRALQHELHPHFLFNTLNTISGLMRTNIDAADIMIDQLADLLRMTLNTSGTQAVPLQHELAMLQKYLQIEQTRFGDRLTIEMQIDADTLGALVPSFLLQPLVENAVRHGVAPHGRPGRIAIRAAHSGGQLTIQIRDNGDGVPPERLIGLNRGVGLANTRARLEHLYPAIHRFELSNMSDGFCVTVSIPYQAEPATDVCTGAA